VPAEEMLLFLVLLSWAKNSVGLKYVKKDMSTVLSEYEVNLGQSASEEACAIVRFAFQKKTLLTYYIFVRKRKDLCFLRSLWMAAGASLASLAPTAQ